MSAALPERIGIAGSGRLARALGRLLIECGEPVAALASRNSEHARATAQFIGPVEAVPLAELPSRARRILIAVSDDAIADVARALRDSGLHQGIALHLSGAAPLESLQCLREAGVARGSMHPLQTIATPEHGVAALRGCWYAIAGDEEATAWAGQIVQKIGGHVLRIAPELRPLYHAAGTLASNALTALLDAATFLLTEAGVEKRDALHAIGPLVRTSVENALRDGPAEALTGPVLRGDVETVAAHLQALRREPETIGELYRVTARLLAEMARRRGTAEERIQAILQLIE